MIVRTVKDRTNPYYLKNRRAADDTRLSFKAKGILDYLLSKPDHWQAHINELVNAGTDGAAAVRSGVDELIEHGYITRVQIRKNGKIVGWRLDTYETPELNPHFADGTAITAVEYLDCDFQDVDNQDVDNRTNSNYSSIVSNDGEVSTPPQKPRLAKQPHSQHQAAMTALNAELSAKERVPYVDPIAAYVGMSKLIETDDYALKKIHRSAIKVHTMGATVQDLRDWWNDWKRDYRSKGASLSQFEKFVSEQLEKHEPAAVVESEPVYMGPVMANPWTEV